MSFTTQTYSLSLSKPIHYHYPNLFTITHSLVRFGHGYTVQISVKPSGAPPPPVIERSTSIRRSIRSGGGPRSPTHSEPAAASPRRTVATSIYDTNPVQQFIVATFPGSLLLESHQVSITIIMRVLALEF